MRKILASLYVIAIFLTVFSCEEDQILEKCDKCLPLYIIYDNNDTISFTYNDNNQIIEIYYSNIYMPRTETFEYDENNKMVKYNEFINGEHREYILYEYSGNSLIKSLFYLNTNNYENQEDYKLMQSEEYELDNNGNIIKLFNSSYYINFKYDSRGNIIEQEKYIYIDPDFNVQLDYIRTCKYGDAYFYYKDLELPINHHYKIYNNLTEQRIENYDFSGEIYYTDILYMHYHSYNEYGYPTSVSKASENGVWLKYKEIVYVVIE